MRPLFSSSTHLPLPTHSLPHLHSSRPLIAVKEGSCKQDVLSLSVSWVHLSEECTPAPSLERWSRTVLWNNSGHLFSLLLHAASALCTLLNTRKSQRLHHVGLSPTCFIPHPPATTNHELVLLGFFSPDHHLPRGKLQNVMLMGSLFEKVDNLVGKMKVETKDYFSQAKVTKIS